PRPRDQEPSARRSGAGAAGSGPRIRQSAARQRLAVRPRRRGRSQGGCMNIAFFSSVALLFALLIFTLASVPLLVLGHDTPLDARVIRRLFSLGYLAIAALAAVCAVTYAIGLQAPFAAGMACVTVLALAVRRWVLQRMDSLADGMSGRNPA